MWAIFNMIAAFFRSVSSTADLAKAAQPTPKEREAKLEIEKPKIEFKVSAEIQDKIFDRVKNNPGADILAAIRSLTNLDPDEERHLLTAITDRVENHRKKRPIISGWRRFEKSLKK